MTEQMPPPPPSQRRRPYVFLWVLIGLLVLLGLLLVTRNDSSPILGLRRDELGQLGYLLIILVFVGSALLGRGLGAGEVVRATAAWLAVFLILLGAYAYRDELTMVGGRLLGVLAPGVPVSGRIAGGGVDDDAVVVVRAIDGHFAVRAAVNDTSITLMFDTGASFVTLTPEDAAAIGIDVSGLRFALPIRTANGTIRAAPIEIDRLAVGSIERRDLPALVAPPDTLDQSLLGMNFLNTLNGYAISGDRLVLTP